MIDLSLKMTVLAAVVWLLTRRVTPRDAAAAHRLWLAVLAMPLLWAIGVMLMPATVVVRPRAGVWPEWIAAPGADLTRPALVVYLSVAALLLGRVGAGVFSVVRLTRRARRLDAADALRLRSLAAVALDLREGDLQVPVTAGALRPVVILPAAWRTMSDAALTAILRHEAAHVRRRDCASALVCALVEAALWFNPAVWLATARVRWFAEMACDAEAAAAMDADEYASTLLALAAQWSGARRPRDAVTAGVGTALGRRIDLLLDETDRHAHSRRALLTSALIAVFLLAAASTAVAFRSTTAAAVVGPTGGHAHAHGHKLGH